MTDSLARIAPTTAAAPDLPHDAPGNAPIAVTLHGCKAFGATDCHESATQTVLGERLAGLRGIRFLGEHVGDLFGAQRDARPGYCYLLPARTLVGLETARALGVRGEDDLFGGVVPFAFVGSKCISHPLPSGDAGHGHGHGSHGGCESVAPEGWSAAFAQRVRPHVLPGFSAFARADALVAGRRLLADGPVRVKPGWGIGGSGQSVARDEAQLEVVVAQLDEALLSQCGVVLEWHLEAVRTLSVGQVTVAGLQAAYCGIQSLTRNASGESVYGGSDLIFVRGGFDALLVPDYVATVARAFRHVLAPTSQQAAPGTAGEPAYEDTPVLRADIEAAVVAAIEGARAYHEAALDCFPGFFASRCNYDVLIGEDSLGRTLAGVLEQSWRMGGASGAEIAALEAFGEDPALGMACASTYERYGEGNDVPAGATVYFQGTDRVLGPFVKYARLHSDCSHIPRR